MESLEKVFDINDYEDVRELLFTDFKENTSYCFQIPYFAQRLNEQYEAKDHYVHLKGMLIHGSVKGIKSGETCLVDLPRSVYDKISKCGNRNSDNIKSYDIVKLKFIRYNKRAWNVTGLEVTK